MSKKFRNSTAGVVISTELQSDGEIVIGGGFNLISGISHLGITQMDANGTPTTLAATGGGMQALFGRRKDRDSASLSYAVQFSADLSASETSTTAPAVISHDGEIEAVTVPYPALISGRKARFFRLSVTLNP